MKPSVKRRLVRQALANNANNIKTFNTQRRVGQFGGLDPLQLAIKDGAKLVRQLGEESKKITA